MTFNKQTTNKELATAAVSSPIDWSLFAASGPDDPIHQVGIKDVDMFVLGSNMKELRLTDSGAKDAPSTAKVAWPTSCNKALPPEDGDQNFPSEVKMDCTPAGSSNKAPSKKRREWTIHVSNIDYCLTKKVFIDYITRKCGRVSGCTFIYDKKKKKFKGSAYVDFDRQQIFSRALKLHGKRILNRRLRVAPKRKKKNEGK